MSPRRKEIKRRRLLQKCFSRYLASFDHINMDEVKFPTNGMIGRFEGVQFIRTGPIHE